MQPTLSTIPLAPFLARKGVGQLISEGNPQTPGKGGFAPLHTPYFIAPLDETYPHRDAAPATVAEGRHAGTQSTLLHRMDQGYQDARAAGAYGMA